MSGDDAGGTPANGDAPGRSWLVPNVLLIALALALAITTAVLLTRGGSADPAKRSAATESARQRAVTEAARAEAVAFLTVDYRAMDPLVAKVLDGATGAFERQYAAAQGSLKTSTRRSKAVSTGRVRAVGVGELGADRAVALVAADSRVSNTSTKGKTQARTYRLKLTLVREGGRWLTSELRFVG